MLGIAKTALIEDMLMIVPVVPWAHHLPGGGLTGQKHALQVDPQHPVEVVLLEIQEIAGVDDPGIGYGTIEAAEGGHGGVDQGVDLGLIADIAGHEERIPATGLDGLGDLLALGGIDVAQDDLGPFRSETLCAGPTDAHGRARHDRYLVLEAHVRILRLR